jgi:hypothetical protein
MSRSALLRVRSAFLGGEPVCVSLNRTTWHALTAVASASNLERGIQVCVCRDLSNVFLKKPHFSQPLRTGLRNEFVCKQPQIICAAHAMTPYPAFRPSYPLSGVKAGVSCDPPSRCDRHDRYQFPSSRIEGCFRDSEKRFGFRSLHVSSRSGFDLATAALYLLSKRLTIHTCSAADCFGEGWHPG